MSKATIQFRQIDARESQFGKEYLVRKVALLDHNKKHVSFLKLDSIISPLKEICIEIDREHIPADKLKLLDAANQQTEIEFAKPPETPKIKLCASDLFAELLPSSIATKALKNIDNRISHLKYESLTDAIEQAIDWKFSPEGQDYWRNIIRQLKVEGTHPLNLKEPQPANEIKDIKIDEIKAGIEKNEELNLLKTELEFYNKQVIEYAVKVQVVQQKIIDMVKDK